MKTVLVVAFVALMVDFVRTQSNPLKDPNICGRPSCRDGGKFKYDTRKQFEYNYSVEVVSLFNGTSKNESRMYVEGFATLNFYTKCDGLLTLHDLKLTEKPTDDLDTQTHPNSELLSESITEYSLRFAFNDGIISEVCPNDEEKSWVLNFKKGLLSMLHNSMRRFDLDHVAEEEDVRGVCKTWYSVKGANGTSLIIEKNKDLNSCRGRAKLHSFVQSTPYSFRPKDEEPLLLHSSSTCQLSIDHHVYNDIVCEERNVFQPFSNRDAGATTIVRQRLSLLSEEDHTLDELEPVSRRTSLLFDHVPTPKPTSGELRSSRDLIKKLCKLSADDVQTKFSDLFTKFIHTLRMLSYTALSTLYLHADVTCPTGRKHMKDALPYIATAPSVALMKDLILRDEVPQSTADDWLFTMAFIPRPDDNMIEPMAELLKHKFYEPSVVFSASALTRSYCVQNKDCIYNDAVREIIRVLENQVLSSYGTKKMESNKVDKVVIALKALSNIGQVSEEFEENLQEMIENDKLEPQVRISAVEVYRRLPCQEHRPYFEDVFRNVDVDVEVRIAAYLQVMRCPTYVTVRTIKHTLEVEEVNQVGSFVWSHLNNILKSSIPSRVEVQGLLSDKDLVKKFSSDVRKFSRNYEGSVFFDEYDFGANYESNVIFSPSSYIPRSAMLNLTVDIFGESINLLEVYGRAEGFEHYLESIFGPNKQYNSKTLQDKIPKFRWARNAPSAEAIKSKVDSVGDVIENEFGKPKVSLGMKIFGNDLMYASRHGEDEIKSTLNTLNPFDHFKQILSGRQINYNKAAMFLDTSYVVASSAGLPLSLNAVGTASINLKLSGSLQMEKFAKNKEFDLTGNIHPSVALDVWGTMSVDAYYASTGIKLKTNMYTSSAIEGRVKVRGKELVSISFDVPRDTTEIFGAKSELIVMKNEVEEPQSGLESNRVSQSICSWPPVEKTVGLKLCADYHFMNVTKLKSAPYLLLAGPAGFRLSLQKSDPTAKKYLFEYRWTRSANVSVISLTFDTPGANARRILEANLTLGVETHNLTVLLQSSAGAVLAHGKYKNVPDEKYMQFSVDVDNKTLWNASCSLHQTQIRNGYNYFPKFYLGVNGERVAELQGTIKSVTKKGITQFDVDLKFQTKRLSSKLFGYVSKTDASIATNLQLDYKFANAKEERVVLNFSFANRSTRNLMAVIGNASLSSTAHPHFNFDALCKLQRGTGHTEFKFEVNSSPLPNEHPETEEKKLTLRVMVVHSMQDYKTRITASATLKRPSTDLDMGLEAMYEASGPDTNALVRVKYATEKEVSVSVFWSHPRTTLEHMEGRLNITIPTFKPMVIEGKLHENKTSVYIVDLKATWFSGHSASATGIYQDKSTSRASNHHFKFMVKSPSFSDITTEVHFYRDNYELKLDAKALHSGDGYGIFLKHTTHSPFEITTTASIKYRTKSYVMNSELDFKERKKLSIELHLDQYRDIHIAAWGFNKETHKAAGMQLKWDANRDPNQKLAVTLDFLNPEPYNYKGNFIVSYPGRTVNGAFDFLMKEGHFSTSSRLSWSTEESVVIRVTANYRNDVETFFSFGTELITPFADWRRTALELGYKHSGNMYRANCTLLWHEKQHVSLEVFTDYASIGPTFTCEFSGGLSSTLHNIASLSASIKHRHNATRVDTSVKVMYDPRQVVALKSMWQISENSVSKNLTGTMTLLSPFKGFNKGILLSKIFISNSRYIRGIADIDLDHKKFTASGVARFARLTDSMLVLNVTTPIEKYKEITARFGISDVQRHVVAEIVYPDGSLGTELLFNVQSFTEFDIKFSLCTPIEFLQRILVVAKLKPETADFRAGLNSFLAGFVGVWHYVNVTDFEYSYKIYTPIKGFEENGVVVKLIFKEGLDSEVSVKLGGHKLGAVVVGKNKPSLLEQLDINPDSIYRERVEDEERYSDDTDSYEDYEEDEYEEPISWAGLLEIDTLIYPTLKGTLDIDQKGDVYVLLATILLPDGDGKAEIRDEFEMEHFLKMKNKLEITTPYETCKIITSDYKFVITPGHQYVLAMDLNYQNRTKWISVGVSADYTSESSDYYNQQQLKLHVHTPFEVFPRLDADAFIQSESAVYRTNFSVSTNSSDISAAAKAKIIGEYMEASADMHVFSPVFKVPPLEFYVVKHFTELQNKFQMNLTVSQHGYKDHRFNSGFIYKSPKNFITHIRLQTPFKGSENSEAGISVFIGNKTADISGMLTLYPIDIHGNVTLKDSLVEGTIIADLNHNINDVHFTCNLTDTDRDHVNLSGVLTLKGKVFGVSGRFLLSDGTPVNGQIQLEPEGGSEPLIFKYQLQPQATGYSLKATLLRGNGYGELEAHSTIRNKFDWDLYLQLSTSHAVYSKFVLDAKASTVGTNRSLVVRATTPLKRMEDLRLSASFAKEGNDSYATLFYDMGRDKGDVQGQLTWMFMENMRLKINGNYTGLKYNNHIAGELYYVNPQKAFKYLTLGGNSNLNHIWTMKSNVTISFPGTNKLNLNAVVKFPPPSEEWYLVAARFDGGRNMDEIEYLVSYRTQNSGHKYGSTGNISYGNSEHRHGDVKVEWNGKRVDNYIDCRRVHEAVNVLYKLRTPKFREQETVVATLTYSPSGDYHNVTCEAFYPGSRSVGSARVDFRELGNMNGTFNVTTPFKGFNYTGATFKTETSGIVYNRYLLLFWPNNSAFIDSKCNIRMVRSALERYTKGLVLIEVPLTTRHSATVDYSYDEKRENSTGLATVEYNRNKIVEGKYNCLSESRAGFDKDTVHVEVENKWLPIGADYVHRFEYSAPREGYNTPTADSRWINMYNLKNRTKFNVTGEVSVKVTSTGQQIALVAIHSNRTVKFMTDYDVSEQQFKQHSKVELGPTAWMEYRLDLLNKTTDETSEAQQIQINVSYPRRNFSAIGSYNICRSFLSSDMSLIWDKEQKKLEAKLDWKRDESQPNRQEVQLQINHPSFEKNITFVGEYEKTSTKYADVRLTVDYAPEEKHRVHISGIVENNSQRGLRNYTYALLATHPATNLNLNSRGGIFWLPRWYRTHHITYYKRSYLPLQNAEALAMLDANNNEIEFKRKILSNLSYLWGRYAGKFPLYTANVSAIHGKDINASGEFYLNFKEKLTRLELNMTTDGSQSLHMYGKIPDARSAFFDIWRNYEEIRISDVSYLLKLNHSRLLISYLKWRPELKQDMKDMVRSVMETLYKDFSEGTDYWKLYIRSQTYEAIAEIRQDAKPYIQGFIDDFKNLKVIQEDLEELRVFLNNSYHANEFYIRDIAGFVVYVFEELSIKSHIESLPAVVSEIWEVMGDTGKKIQKSVQWIIEKIKQYYKNATEFINGLVQGDTVEHISDALKQLVEKYDNFIKEMHVAFIRYMEQLWKHTYAVMVDNWYKTLASIEPTFLKFVHYLETIVWNTSKEFLDFLYMRKNELVEHPYFSKFSNFTQDLDKFYKDMTGNDTIASVYKYSKIVYNFLKEKYFKLVPFGKELQDVATEILTELNQLRELRSVRYLTEVFNQIYNKGKWVYEYFDMERRLHRFITLIHRKLTDMTYTALEAENRYRVAKTKFIFEPSDGIMHLEQKLPMSWHAFNESPNFQEIPEFKTIYDAQNYFAASKASFWNFYHDYKPFTDPADWFPPFQAQAMLFGGRYYVTFDRVAYSFQGSCSYLLTSDFLDYNFTLAVSYDSKLKRARELIVLVNNTIVKIDLLNKAVNVGENENTKLPVAIGNAVLYHESDIVTLESQLGFTVECNLKFDICSLEVSGWYFGKTAGLWGTMNNEAYDDLITSTKHRLGRSEIADFVKSWSIDQGSCGSESNVTTSSYAPPSDDIRTLCEAIFSSKVSPFVTCFSRVPSEPFLSMCLESTSEEEACTTAVSYMSLCSYSNTPLRIPDFCVKCNLPNGTVAAEGDFVVLSDAAVPQSADVVFIIEAKECNKGLRSNQKLDIVAEQLYKELSYHNLTNIRYSVVGFGGDGVLDQPRSVVGNQGIFVNHYQSLLPLFDHITPGNGSSDIYAALVYAMKLVFRPGVSKNFILLPCSDCKESNMKLDYSILHQSLLESDVILHILMNEEFQLPKTRTNKILFGIDGTYAYTKKDVNGLKGDTSLRKQVRLPKTTLGFCTPLAFESNGSVFTAKKLMSASRKVASVFAKRIAQSAIPSKCKTCECTAHNTGVSYMECSPCSYPTRATIDYGFDEDEALAVMQPGDQDFFDIEE